MMSAELNKLLVAYFGLIGGVVTGVAALGVGVIPSVAYPIKTAIQHRKDIRLGKTNLSLPKYFFHLTDRIIQTELRSVSLDEINVEEFYNLLQLKRNQLDIVKTVDLMNLVGDYHSLGDLLPHIPKKEYQNYALEMMDSGDRNKALYHISDPNYGKLGTGPLQLKDEFREELTYLEDRVKLMRDNINIINGIRGPWLNFVRSVDDGRPYVESAKELFRDNATRDHLIKEKPFTNTGLLLFYFIYSAYTDFNPKRMSK